MMDSQTLPQESLSEVKHRAPSSSHQANEARSTPVKVVVGAGWNVSFGFYLRYKAKGGFSEVIPVCMEGGAARPKSLLKWKLIAVWWMGIHVPEIRLLKEKQLSGRKGNRHWMCLPNKETTTKTGLATEILTLDSLNLKKIFTSTPPHSPHLKKL